MDVLVHGCVLGAASLYLAYDPPPNGPVLSGGHPPGVVVS